MFMLPFLTMCTTIVGISFTMAIMQNVGNVFNEEVLGETGEESGGAAAEVEPHNHFFEKGSKRLTVLKNIEEGYERKKDLEMQDNPMRN